MKTAKDSTKLVSWHGSGLTMNEGKAEMDIYSNSETDAYICRYCMVTQDIDSNGPENKLLERPMIM